MAGVASWSRVSYHTGHATQDARRETGNTVKIKVKVKPRSSRPGVEKTGEGLLVVKVKAAPVAGKANAEVCKLLADHFGVAKSSVGVVKGGKSRDKVVEISGK